MVVVMPADGAPAGLPNAIAVGRYEVTRDEFAVFEKEAQVPPARCELGFDHNESREPSDMNRKTPGLGRFQPSGRDPASCISWIEAQAYVEWLSGKTGEKYRLPSKQEGRYFERGGATTRYAWGDLVSDACVYANVLDRTGASQDWATKPKPDWKEELPTLNGVVNCDDGAAYTAPVGSYKPNVFGLYDTTGNVWEWTADCITDEKLLPEGSYYPVCFVLGSGWLSGEADLSDETNDFPFKGYSNEHWASAGFRVVRLISD